MPYGNNSEEDTKTTMEKTLNFEPFFYGSLLFVSSHRTVKKMN